MAKNNDNTAAIGLGLAAAAAAAGGAYWLYGAKHSAKHRKMAKSWMLKARAEVMDAVEKLEDIDKEKYMQIAESVIKNYATKGASADEIASMMKDFKAAWKHMQAPKKTVKKVAKRARKSPAKKKGSRTARK